MALLRDRRRPTGLAISSVWEIEQRLDDPQSGRPERPARLGDLDHGVGDVGHLGLGRPVGEPDFGVHPVLLQVASGQLGVLGRHPQRRAPSEAARSATESAGESSATARTTRIGLAVALE